MGQIDASRIPRHELALEIGHMAGEGEPVRSEIASQSSRAFDC